MKSIAAIDPGTKCGWATEKNGTMISGVWNLSISKHESAGTRFLKFASSFRELITTMQVEIVFFEDVKRHAGTQAAHVYGGFISQLMTICEENDVQYMSIPVGTIKKLATGKGVANKEAMMAAACNRWPGNNWESDDECDARWILEAGKSELGM